MTQEEIVMRGENAALYLQDDCLMSFIKEMKTDLQFCIVNTRPEEHDQRSRLYYQHLGLVDLLTTLSAYRDAANEIIQRNEREQEALKEADTLYDE